MGDLSGVTGPGEVAEGEDFEGFEGERDDLGAEKLRKGRET